ncbi:hypothetical protein [Eleftheria terrae]|uniref:hypothetical protein n=1 Tax=Eleftheria terrae TaxID=1597781 RepID=UPI00263B9442|nr:hypothetical protein [Eleftheria terrae]WKB52753.1 hypothetical protein N7L95_23750 [Eleftheria terrae]
MHNGTWSSGDQRGFKKFPGGNADCGQHAAGDIAGGYQVGSIDPHGATPDQPPAVRTPASFHHLHGLIGPLFRQLAAPPAHAQAVAFVVPQTGAFHYGRLQAGPHGITITQTDANKPNTGGTFMKFAANPGGQVSLDNMTGQRGVQPIDTYQTLAEFVDYCHANYGQGLFFFCRFG